MSIVNFEFNETTSEQTLPLALSLAKHILISPSHAANTAEKVAAELVRLYKENARLRAAAHAPQRKPDHHAFMEWADKAGYDTAYTINSDNGKFMPLSPMCGDLWQAWQAAHGIKE